MDLQKALFLFIAYCLAVFYAALIDFYLAYCSFHPVSCLRWPVKNYELTEENMLYEWLLLLSLLNCIIIVIVEL